MSKLVSSLLTLAKVALRSKSTGGRAPRGKGRKLIVMGNGPSLRDTIDSSEAILMAHDTMAVNFAANTPEFFRLRPRHYILADPHFFKVDGPDHNVERLWTSLRKVDWEMTLHLPITAKGFLANMPENVECVYFNMTPAEGYDSICHTLYRRGMALPRPRNVLIPAIMEGMRDGYKEIYIVGADHTWPHTLYVDDLNRVVSVQPHFYEDNRKELDRVAREYAGIRLHDVLGSMVIAFRSYHEIRRYAEKCGVEIVNATPGSLIDAFVRRSLPDSR